MPGKNPVVAVCLAIATPSQFVAGEERFIYQR